MAEGFFSRTIEKLVRGALDISAGLLEQGRGALKTVGLPFKASGIVLGALFSPKALWLGPTAVMGGAGLLLRLTETILKGMAMNPKEMAALFGKKKGDGAEATAVPGSPAVEAPKKKS